MRLAVAGGTGTIGQYVLEVAESKGHHVAVLSRSRGVDLRSGQGIAAALEGVEAIVDVVNPSAADRPEARDFFEDVARQLQSAGRASGVRHLVLLSIVGIERSPGYAYYAAKLHEEHVVLEGELPASVLRATQFHEYAAQMLRAGLRDGRSRVRDMPVQSVAARTVAEALVDLAVGAPLGRAKDIAGPREENLLQEARAFVGRYELNVEVVEADADGGMVRGANLPDADARLVGPTFAQWLDSDDAARMAERFRDWRSSAHAGCCAMRTSKLERSGS